MSVRTLRSVLLRKSTMCSLRIGLAIGLFITVGESGTQSFEVASVKSVQPGAGGPSIVLSPGGRFNAGNVTLRRLIRWAYHVQDFQILGGPDERNQPIYEVIAKASSNADAEQLSQMVQALLTDRFKLRLHHEMKETQVYALVVGNSDQTKLKEFTNSAEGQSHVRFTSCGMELAFPAGASLSQLANFLSGQSWMDRPVIDRTGLKGIYDLKLQFSVDGPVSLVEQALESGAPPPPPPPQSDVPCSRYSIFEAVQNQLGLKLESQKARIEVIVIDHWEKPSEN